MAEPGAYIPPIFSPLVRLRLLFGPDATPGTFGAFGFLGCLPLPTTTPGPPAALAAMLRMSNLEGTVPRYANQASATVCTDGRTWSSFTTCWPSTTCTAEAVSTVRS